MYTSQYKSIIELAASRGSSAKTPAGARRFLLAQLREHRRTRPFGWTPGRELRDASARAKYERTRDERRAECICVRAGLWTYDEAAALARMIDYRILDNAMRGDYPYRVAESSWAGGDHTTTLRFGDEPGAWCRMQRVWSSNGKWSGNDSHVTLTITRRAVCALDNLLIGGLITLDAEQVGPREYRAVWAEQSRGVALKTVSGWIIKGYHVRGGTLATARKKAAAARQKSLAAALARRMQRKSQAELLRQAARIWVTVQDSTAAGNCAPGTEAFARKVRGELGDVFAVRGDVLLQIRDDMYVRRALAVAAQGH